MIQSFHELVIGGVLVTPFLTYMVLAALLLAILRPVLHELGFERAFANPPLALLGLYVVLVAALIVMI